MPATTTWEMPTTYSVQSFLTRAESGRPMTSGIVVEVAREALGVETAAAVADLAHDTTDAEVGGKIVLVALDDGVPLVAVFQRVEGRLAAAWCGNAVAAASAVYGSELMVIGPEHRVIPVATDLSVTGIQQDWKIAWAPTPIEVALARHGRVWFTHTLNDYVVVAAPRAAVAFVPQGNAKAVELRRVPGGPPHATFALRSGARRDAPLTGLIELAAARAASPTLEALIPEGVIDLSDRKHVALPTIETDGTGVRAVALLTRTIEIGELQ